MPVLFALAFGAAVAWWPYPRGVDRAPPSCTWIEDRGGTPLAAFASSSGDWHLPLSESEMSPHLLDAIVAVEDARFYEHGGVDWRSAIGAMWQDLTTLSLHRGASTITMQLHRLRDPAPRSLAAKVSQAVRACQIERFATKRQILVEYLNRAPFGGNLVGAGAASWRYFGRPCRELSLGQAALLAGLPQGPNRFRPDRFPARARQRRDHVLDRMLACGMITAAERREAANEPTDARWGELPQYLADPAKSADGLLPALTRLAARHPGETIHTTFDAATQRQTAAAARAQLAALAASHISAVAVVVLDTSSGECLASVSCGDESAKAIDLTARPRSSGSTLKPFIYAAAFDAGVCTPQTVLDDSPSSWSGYEPANYDRAFRGPLVAAEALAQSRNVPALALLSKVGVDRAVEVMRAMGLATLSRTPQRYGLPLAIGGAEVTPMELAQAYAALARGAVLTGNSPGRKAGDQSANHAGCSFDPRPSGLGYDGSSSDRVLRWTTCLTTLNCLADPERTAHVCPAAARVAPAWKTSTSSGHRDAWCAAVTPRRTVVVWLGNADGSGADALVGQEVAAPLALQIIAAEDRVIDEGFAPPVGFAVARGDSVAAPMATLAMVSPANGQEIVRDPSLPAEQQRFSLRAKTGGDDAEVWWFVDGQCVAHCKAAEPAWWSPVTGVHRVSVVDAAGRSDAAQVSVRE